MLITRKLPKIYEVWTRLYHTLCKSIWQQLASKENTDIEICNYLNKIQIQKKGFDRRFLAFIFLNKLKHLVSDKITLNIPYRLIFILPCRMNGLQKNDADNLKIFTSIRNHNSRTPCTVDANRKGMVPTLKGFIMANEIYNCGGIGIFINNREFPISNMDIFDIGTVV